MIDRWSNHGYSWTSTYYYLKFRPVVGTMLILAIQITAMFAGQHDGTLSVYQYLFDKDHQPKKSAEK